MAEPPVPQVPPVQVPPVPTYLYIARIKGAIVSVAYGFWWYWWVVFIFYSHGRKDAAGPGAGDAVLPSEHSYWGTPVLLIALVGHAAIAMGCHIMILDRVMLDLRGEGRETGPETLTLLDSGFGFGFYQVLFGLGPYFHASRLIKLWPTIHQNVGDPRFASALEQLWVDKLTGLRMAFFLDFAMMSALVLYIEVAALVHDALTLRTGTVPGSTSMVYVGAPIWAFSPLPAPYEVGLRHLTSGESMVRTGCSIAPFISLASIAIAFLDHYVHETRSVFYLAGASELRRDEGLLVRALAYVDHVAQVVMFLPLAFCLGTPGAGYVFWLHLLLLMGYEYVLMMAKFFQQELPPSDERDPLAFTMVLVLLMSLLASLPKSLLGSRGLVWPEFKKKPSDAPPNVPAGGRPLARALSKRATSAGRLMATLDAPKKPSGGETAAAPRSWPWSWLTPWLQGGEALQTGALGVKFEVLSPVGCILLAERALMALLGWWLLSNEAPQPNRYLSPDQLAPPALGALIGGVAAAALARLGLFALSRARPDLFDAPYQAASLLGRPPASSSETTRQMV